MVAHTPCSVIVNDSNRRKQYEIHHHWAKQYLRPYTTFDMFENDTLQDIADVIWGEELD